MRPELLLDSLVFLAVVLAVEWSPWSWKDRIRLVAWAAALPVIYQVFRMGYYGEIVANTAIAKEGPFPAQTTGCSTWSTSSAPTGWWSHSPPS